MWGPCGFGYILTTDQSDAGPWSPSNTLVYLTLVGVHTGAQLDSYEKGSNWESDEWCARLLVFYRLDACAVRCATARNRTHPQSPLEASPNI
eukprot:546753-Prorocentrum_minimum.AAC.3